jgi:rare lipoprotein A
LTPLKRTALTALGTLAALLLAACGGPKPKVGAPDRAVAAHTKRDPTLPALPAAGSGRGGYYQDDGPGENPPPNLRDVPDAVVKDEVLSKFSNRPYVVFGQTYTPIAGNSPFSQRGVASWYGKKFHGQRTSSGELYDMYKMTAAHPTLPIPSYARITSLTTGEQVVVRINDRGPFHSSRIVDVSYTAALKLGLLGKGSHDVVLERLMPGDPVRVASARAHPPAVLVPAIATVLAPAPSPVPAPAAAQVSAPAPAPALSPTLAALMLEDRLTPGAEPPALIGVEPPPAAARAVTDGFYLQLGAYSRPDRAAEVRAHVLAAGVVEIIEVVQAGAVYRLYGGPFVSREEARLAGRALPAALAIKPIVVRRSAD